MARKPAYRITPARLADLDGIMEIERASFRTPWSRQVFIEEFKHELSRLAVVHDESLGRVVAFINYWVVHDEIHVLNVATHPDWRRRGLALDLMRHAIQEASGSGARLITLEVRRSNRAARRLYERLGFEVAGVRPRYYENDEDAIVMNLDLE